MNVKAILFLLGVLSLGIAHAGESVVLGHALSNRPIEGVETACPPEDICMNGWFRWTIKVDATLNGDKISGRIVAARIQHAGLVSWYQRKLRIFVLAPIEDETQRKLLGAKYYLRDVSFPHEMYCLDERVDSGIDADSRMTAPGMKGRYCFELPEADKDG